MQNPNFVSLNGHRIKVQRWQEDAGTFTFTSVIRGEHLGNDIVAAVQHPQITLALDDDITLHGSARVLDRRVTGAGSTAVVRLEIRFDTDDADGLVMELTADQKLDAILAEVRALRREVDALRGRSAPLRSGVAPPAPGKTLLDFEIPTEDE